MEEKKKTERRREKKSRRGGGGLTGVVVVVKGEAASVRTAQGGRNQCQQVICGQLTRGGNRWSAYCWNPQRNRGNSRQKNSEGREKEK